MNNDLISREVLKEDFKSRLALCNEWIEKAKDKETKIRASAVKAYIAEVIMTINNAPTVTPTFGLFKEMLCSECEKRPQGEWKVKGQDIYCSICNGESAYNEFGASKFSNFCPNCGADMRGAENA